MATFVAFVLFGKIIKEYSVAGEKGEGVLYWVTKDSLNLNGLTVYLTI